MTLKFNSVLEVVEVHVPAKCAAVHELSTVHYISDNCRLWSRISPERIKQSTSGKRRYHLWLFPRSGKQLGELWSINEKMNDLAIQ